MLLFRNRGKSHFNQKGWVKAISCIFHFSLCTQDPGHDVMTWVNEWMCCDHDTRHKAVTAVSNCLQSLVTGSQKFPLSCMQIGLFKSSCHVHETVWPMWQGSGRIKGFWDTGAYLWTGFCSVPHTMEWIYWCAHLFTSNGLPLLTPTSQKPHTVAATHCHWITST